MHPIRNLLVFVYTLDPAHGALAWQYDVVRKLAGEIDNVTVIAETVAPNLPDVPSNMRIIPLPKRPLHIPQRLGGRIAFNVTVNKLLKKEHFDAVFLHMASDWAWRLAPAFKANKVPVLFWYAHGTVTNKLRLSAKLADRIVTSTPEGCRLNSPKVKVIGQAINWQHFTIPQHRDLSSIVYVGRISQRKHIDKSLDVLQALKGGILDRVPFHVYGPLLNMADVSYDQSLRKTVWDKGLQDQVDLQGYVPYAHMPSLYSTPFLHLSFSETGSMDKTVMEALACGCPVLTGNPAFKDVLAPYPEFVIKDARAEAVAEQVKHIHARRRDYDPQALRALVEPHALDTYADRILAQIEDMVRNDAF
jgi:glycosyltransferase involved in cell wall biosynthesis